MKSIMKIVTLVMLLSIWAVPSAFAQSGTHTYEVTMTNLTGKQGMSPLVLAAHSPSMHAWQKGQMASEGVRLVAESGMPDTLIAELTGKVTDVQKGPGILMPGNSVTVRITANEGDVLSAASMLGTTNDTFTGFDSVALTPGTIEAMAYDAGTEDNTELAADVPGPPLGGMGHHATTPQGVIADSPGVRGDADLDSSFGWEPVVARFEIRAVTDDMPTGMPSTGRGGNGFTAALPYVLVAGAVVVLTALGMFRAVRTR